MLQYTVKTIYRNESNHSNCFFFTVNNIHEFFLNNQWIITLIFYLNLWLKPNEVYSVKSMTNFINFIKKSIKKCTDRRNNLISLTVYELNEKHIRSAQIVLAH